MSDEVRRTGVLATANIRLEQDGKIAGEIRCLIDSGAQISLISMAIVKHLGLAMEARKAMVSGIGGIECTHGIVKATIRARDISKWGTLEEFAIVSKIMDMVPSSELDYFTEGKIPTSDLADLRYNVPAPVDIVLGAGVCARLFRGNVIRLRKGLIAMDTEIGYIIFGEHLQTGNRTCQMIGQASNDSALEIALKRLWEADQVEEAKAEMKPDEVWCEKHFDKTCYRDEDGRYVVSIPIKPEALKLGESYPNALRRFQSLEKRLQQNPELATQYSNFMREYEELGHMRVATRPVSSAQAHYYIPHHPVLKKFRVVFDASAKTTNGRSLNDIQLSGPKLQPDLYNIMLKFRAGRIALSADIRKMFRQVRVREDQWDLQRILWRANPGEDLKEYWLTVVTYGFTSAGYNAVKAMLKCITDSKEEFPLASKVVAECFYMDDMLVSVETLDQAREIYRQAKEALLRGGFELAKWASNEPQAICEETGQNMVSVEGDEVSVLGLWWEPMTDELRFNVQTEELANTLTKRQVASQGAKLFDPNGYVTPITIRAKIFMQNLWRIGVQWDEPLKTETVIAWKSYYESLKELADLKLPRWVGIESQSKLQLHVFADASLKAYGAAVYVRVEDSNSCAKVKLLTSKSKVADLKTVSTPRLELCAAKLAARLGQHVSTELAVRNADIFYWTDSEIVLHWLRKFPSELKVYVGNRVSDIQACSKIKRWRHIDSKRNPADLISRGLSVKDLIRSDLWWHGPAFLKEPEINWPLWRKGDPNPESLKVIASESRKLLPHTILLVTVCAAGEKPVCLLERFERLAKIIRVTAYVMRFIQGCRIRVTKNRITSGSVKERQREKANHRQSCGSATGAEPLITIRDEPLGRAKSGRVTEETLGHSEIKSGVKSVKPISVKEYSDALAYWMRYTQHVHFANELKCLARKEPVCKASRIYNFVPFIEESTGLIRMRGRIDRSSLTYDQRHPILLPCSSTLALKLMAEAHQMTLHGGNQICMQYLRDRYWIIGLRSAMRHFIRRCVICAARARKMASQLMADLPEPRVSANRPFTHCGVDFAGPFKLKAYKNARNSKVQLTAYVAVFVCFASKAVHLELVGDLTTQAFLGALDRMILRKYNVEHLYSDQGRNFIGAANELQRIYEFWQSSDIINDLTIKGITWHFNTPLAPHHGGLWEAAVKSFKFHLKRAAGESVFTFEELNTLLVRIEACLNSRPLVAPSDDPMDLTIITPGHLLTGRQIIRPLGPNSLGASNGNIAWDRIRSIEDDIWQRWSKEYLTELQKRSKWASERANVKIGDLVIIKEDVMPPGHWKRGRVTEVYPGKDGLVRSVRIKTATSEYERPVTRLCILPVDSNLAQAVQSIQDGM